MADKWRTITLGQVCDFLAGSVFPKEFQGEVSGEYPFIKVSDMNLPGNERWVESANHWISQSTREKLRVRVHPAGATAFAKIGIALTYNRRRILRQSTILDNNMMSAVPDTGVIDPLFFYYLLRTLDFNDIVCGTALPYLNISDLKCFSVLLPPLPEQRAIAHILGTLDDKIELNRKMNDTLEAMARAIFKSWFIDFDPVQAKAEGRDPKLPKEIADLFPDSFQDSELGKIPKGWRVADLGEIAEVIDCLHSKKPERQTTGKPLLQLWNIRDDSLIDMTDAYSITDDDYQRWISRMEGSPGDCVITNVGRVAATAQIPEGLHAALGRNMTGIRCRISFPYPTFLIECLRSSRMKEEITFKTDTGTILNALNVRNIPKLRFVKPADDIVVHFESICRPIRSKMERIFAQSCTLATIRDALLPKLLSGEIRVDRMDKVDAEARR